MKKVVKIITILLISLIILTNANATTVFAEDINPSQTITDLDGKSGTTVVNQAAQDSMLLKAGKVIGFIRWIAIIAGVLIITILGFKYMMGSLEEKADYKKSFIPLIVGIVVVMSSTVIASLIISTFQ